MASILCMRLSQVRRMGSAALLAAARRLYISLHVRFRASLHANSNARVLDCLSCFSDLLNLSFLFQCREIPCRCCVGDVKQFLNFVVGDFAFHRQRFQDFFEFLSLPLLNRGACFHQEIAPDMRYCGRGCCRRTRRRLRRLRRGRIGLTLPFRSLVRRRGFGRQRLIYWYLSRWSFSGLRFALRRFRLRGSRSHLRRCRSWLYNGRRGLRCVFFCHVCILP